MTAVEKIAKRSMMPETEVSKSPTPNTSLATSASLGVIGSIVKGILVYCYAIAISRIAGPDVLGLYTLGSSLVFVLLFASDLGLSIGSIRFVSIAVSKADFAQVKGTIVGATTYVLSMSMLVSVGVALMAPTIAGYYKRPLLTPIIYIIAVAIPFMTLTNVFTAVGQGFKSIREKVIARDVLQPLIELCLGAAGLMILGKVASWTAIAYTLSAFIACWVAYRRLMHLFIRFDDKTSGTKRIDRELLAFSLPLMISRLTSTFAFRIGLLALGFWYSSAVVAYFGAVILTTQFLTLILVAFGSILGSYVAELMVLSDRKRLGQIYAFSTRWIVALSAPLVVLIILAADDILSLFGPDYIQASMPLRIIAAAQLINVGVGATDTVLVATGHSKLDAVNNIVLLFFTTSVAIWLVPGFGLMGAAITQASAIIVINTIKTIQIRHLYGILPTSSALMRYVVALGCSGLLVWVTLAAFPHLKGFYRIVWIAVELLVCYQTLLLLFGIEEDDIAVLGEAWQRLKCVIRDFR